MGECVGSLQLNLLGDMAYRQGPAFVWADRSGPPLAALCTMPSIFYSKPGVFLVAATQTTEQALKNCLGRLKY